MIRLRINFLIFAKILIHTNMKSIYYLSILLLAFSGTAKAQTAATDAADTPCAPYVKTSKRTLEMSGTGWSLKENTK
jgi:hypothetical protein